MTGRRRLDRLEENGRETVESTVSAIDAVNDVPTDAVRGRPSEAVFECVGEQAIYLVAMGTHGRSGLGRFVLGSTAETVFNPAEMPVFSVTASDRES